jgi:hypothetical protein
VGHEAGEVGTGDAPVPADVGSDPSVPGVGG